MDFSLNALWNNIIRRGSGSGLTEIEFLELELQAWIDSGKRNQMIVGKRYFDGDHDILNKQRQAVDANGNARTVNGLPNNRIVDNRYAELVDQKVSYLLSKPMEVRTDDEVYGEQLDAVFNQTFRRRLKNLGTDVLNCGMGYLHPYISMVNFGSRGLHRNRSSRFGWMKNMKYWTHFCGSILSLLMRARSRKSYGK